MLGWMACAFWIWWDRRRRREVSSTMRRRRVSPRIVRPSRQPHAWSVPALRSALCPRPARATWVIPALTTPPSGPNAPSPSSTQARSDRGRSLCTVCSVTGLALIWRGNRDRSPWRPIRWPLLLRRIARGELRLPLPAGLIHNREGQRDTDRVESSTGEPAGNALAPLSPRSVPHLLRKKLAGSITL